MKTDLFAKVALLIIAVLLFLNLLSDKSSSASVTAEQTNAPIDRYHISA